MSDGIMVIVGDMAPETVQKALLKYLGGFRVGRQLASRQTAQNKLRTGTSSYSKDGPVKIEISMAAYTSFTTENFMAFKIAALAIQRKLAGTMGELGFCVTVKDKVKLPPQDIMEIKITCDPVPQEGLPFGVKSGIGGADGRNI